jgi:pimeloyl-ACP methyl ester carboxylesterase
LEGIDHAYESADWLNQLMTQRKWLLKLGGVYHTRTSYTHEVLLLLKSREYSLVESALWTLGSARSLQRMWPELMRLDFSQTVRQVQVPVYFFVGRYDMNTPYPLIEKYYAHLSAPAGKELVWFEDSAHSILIDQPDKIAQELIRVTQQ